jgi:signal transduction histidine kinase
VSLKAVLALMQTAILAVGLALLGTLVVESFERSLRTDADDLLGARADALDTAVRDRMQVRVDDGALDDLEPDPSAFDAFSTPGLLFEVWDAEGRLVAAAPGLPAGGLPWSADARAALSRGQQHLESAPSGGGHWVRVLTRPVVEDGRLVAIVRVGESLRPIDRAVADLMRPLIVGGLLILVASIVVTWVVVSRALEPLESIAATAERIALTGDVSLTVEPEGTGEARRLAIAFNRMIERLRRLLESQRQLLADTSHELRNPLTVVRTDLDLLGRELDPDTRQEVATEAAEEAERMSRLVADLLYLTREEQVERGPAEAVRLHRLVAEVIERLQQVAPDHEVRLGHADPAIVLGNRDRLHQLVTNLIENGIRYTPAGGHVTVDVRITDDRTARLDVVDDGIGIAPEHLPRVFDRFYRVDPARARATGGTGLGLAIVKHVAESHGGTVEATSEPGAGSTFTVILPAEPTAAEPPTPASLEPTIRDLGSPEDPGVAPSGHAVGSQPAETLPTTDHPAPRR